jgi:photosystem II stability/assembly factor-like uncharacterized protein
VIALSALATTVWATGTAGAERAAPPPSWSIQRQFPVPEDSEAVIACSSAAQCVASEGNEELVTTNGGRSWKTRDLPSGVDYLGGISCPTATRCWAVGRGDVSHDDSDQMLATDDNGKRWTVETLPAGIFGVYGGISCPNASDCTALSILEDGADVGIVFTTNGGRTWSTGSDEMSGFSQGPQLSCPTPSVCWAADFSPDPHGQGTIAELVGAKGPQGTPPPSNYGGISCPDPSHCWAVTNAGAVVATKDGGRAWATESLPLETGPTGTITCPTISDCWAIGAAGNVAHTKDGGKTWSTERLPSDVAIIDITCPRVSLCWAVGAESDDAVILVRD